MYGGSTISAPNQSVCLSVHLFSLSSLVHILLYIGFQRYRRRERGRKETPPSGKEGGRGDVRKRHLKLKEGEGTKKRRLTLNKEG